MSDNCHSSPLQVRRTSRFLVSEFSGTVIEMTPEKPSQGARPAPFGAQIVGSFHPLEDGEKFETSLANTADKSTSSGQGEPEPHLNRRNRHTLATIGFGFIDRLQLDLSPSESEGPCLAKLQTRERSRTLCGVGSSS